MEVTWQTVITAAAFVGAVGTLIGVLVKLVRWVDKQKEQTTDIEELKAEHAKDIQEVKTELQVLCYGMLAALDGLMQNGANGNVTKAHARLEKHLNSRSHK